MQSIYATISEDPFQFPEAVFLEAVSAILLQDFITGEQR
jgi:hypothetical protein